MRFWETTVISFYCELYFDYYDKPSVYGTLNALVILFGGLTSALVAGRICDKLDDHWSVKIKPYICCGMSLAALPLFFFVFCVHFNFYFSMVFLFFENLLAEGWMGPCIAMIQQVIDTKYKAVSIGVFFWGTSMAQSLSCVVVGTMLNDFKLTD